MHQNNGIKSRYSSVNPGPLVVTMSSKPNGPPVAYAYITKTNGNRLALRSAVRVPLRELDETVSRLWSGWLGMFWLEMLATLDPCG